MSIKDSLTKQPRNGFIGHEQNAPARYAETTRHMVIFEAASENFPIAAKGERVRLYLSDMGYRNITERAERGEVRIIRQARVKRGEIIADAPERDQEY